jgi:hypothetical protein
MAEPQPARYRTTCQLELVAVKAAAASPAAWHSCYPAAVHPAIGAGTVQAQQQQPVNRYGLHHARSVHHRSAALLLLLLLLLSLPIPKCSHAPCRTLFLPWQEHLLLPSAHTRNALVGQQH